LITQDVASDAERATITMASDIPLRSLAYASLPQVLSIQVKSRLYDENLELVKRYFYRTYKQIENRRLVAASGAEFESIHAAKAEIWSSAERLSKTEDRLNILSHVKSILTVLTVMAVVSATLLNLPNEFATLVGSLYLYIQTLNMFVLWASQWNQADLRLYAQLLEEYRAQVEKEAENDNSF
jgi:ABC-type multidrug transport system fused ATPase/permease subunit